MNDLGTQHGASLKIPSPALTASSKLVRFSIPVPLQK
jgi:hypothetical protein